MKNVFDASDEVISLLQEKAGDLSEADRLRAIEHAVERYSQARPRAIVADITGDGGQDYDPPAGWVEEWSSLKSVEYPVGQIPAVYLEDGDFEIYQTPSAKKIRLRRVAPQATESFRVTFTGLHSLTESTGTVSDGDFRALCHLAASAACQMLANRYSQLSDSTIGADAVDHKSKAAEYAARGRELLKVYREHLGGDPSVPKPGASVVQDWDRDFPWGEDRLTHPRRWR